VIRVIVKKKSAPERSASPDGTRFCLLVTRLVLLVVDLVGAGGNAVAGVNSQRVMAMFQQLR